MIGFDAQKQKVTLFVRLLVVPGTFFDGDSLWFALVSLSARLFSSSESRATLVNPLPFLSAVNPKGLFTVTLSQCLFSADSHLVPLLLVRNVKRVARILDTQHACFLHAAFDRLQPFISPSSSAWLLTVLLGYPPSLSSPPFVPITLLPPKWRSSCSNRFFFCFGFLLLLLFVVFRVWISILKMSTVHNFVDLTSASSSSSSSSSSSFFFSLWWLPSQIRFAYQVKLLLFHFHHFNPLFVLLPFLIAFSFSFIFPFVRPIHSTYYNYFVWLHLIFMSMKT